MREESIRVLIVLGATAWLAGAPVASASAQQEGARTSPCDPLATDSAIALVQSSDELLFALHALAEGEAAMGGTVDSARIQRLCAAMDIDRPPLLGGVALVHAPAMFHLEPSFMVFAIEADRVVLLNPRPDGVFRFGLRRSDWNEFLDSTGTTLAIDDPAAAGAYACLLLTYLQNHMGGGGSACSVPMNAAICRTGDAGWIVAIKRFRHRFVFRRDGRVLDDGLIDR